MEHEAIGTAFRRQLVERCVDGVPGVDDQRLVAGSRDRDMGAEGLALPLPRRGVAIEVEARLPDGHRSRPAGELANPLGPYLIPVARLVRVHAHRGIDPALPGEIERRLTRTLVDA